MYTYLDNSATTRPYKEVIDLMVDVAFSNYGNPSSMHSMGVTGEKIIKTARRQVATALEVSPGEIFFNSGGTEGNNTAITGAALARRRLGNRVITTKIEHPAVLESFKVLEGYGFQAIYVNVDKDGYVDMEEMAHYIDDQTILISCMHVNNETGAIQPIEEIGKIKGNAIFHSDCVQSFCKVKIPTKDLDLITVSGHKIHGPKGSGALYIKKGLNIIPLIHGGGQESNIRPGTENVPAIAGLGLAAEIGATSMEVSCKEISALRDKLKNQLLNLIKDIRINTPERSVPGVLNVSFNKTRGEVLLHRLEQSQIFLSTGSACSSNKKGQSHVLAAMGLNNSEIEGAIRFSLCKFNSEEAIDFTAKEVAKAVESFRRLGSFR